MEDSKFIFMGLSNNPVISPARAHPVKERYARVAKVSVKQMTHIRHGFAVRRRENSPIRDDLEEADCHLCRRRWKLRSEGERAADPPVSRLRHPGQRLTFHNQVSGVAAIWGNVGRPLREPPGDLPRSSGRSLDPPATAHICNADPNHISMTLLAPPLGPEWVNWDLRVRDTPQSHYTSLREIFFPAFGGSSPSIFTSSSPRHCHCARFPWSANPGSLSLVTQRPRKVIAKFEGLQGRPPVIPTTGLSKSLHQYC
ncbi:hypothetical protein J6590_002044 [Homalodisca vitripennis]|nr:hypothetical protein J6590_002044 [Homalodisca vitripennis]